MALINRDTLRAKFNTIIVGTDENRDALLSVREAMKLIDLEPTVDAVEVVQCRDCHRGQWISVEDSLPPEHDTIFARLYGTDKWRRGMFRKMSDDVRVVKVYRDGTKRVHHDHTVDGVWDSERKGPDVYGHVTHWMSNPELPKEG